MYELKSKILNCASDLDIWIFAIQEILKFSTSPQPNLIKFYLCKENQDRDDFFSLKLNFNKKHKLLSIEYGPKYSKEIENEIINSFSEIKKTSETFIARLILFCSTPVDGFFKYQNKFQIVPVPENAPRPRFYSSLHPFIVEVRIPKTNSNRFNLQQAEKAREEYANILNVLLNKNISTLTQGHQWIISEKNNTKCFIGHFGYDLDNFSLFQAEFTETENQSKLNGVKYEEYYQRSYAQSLDLPSNFESSLCRYFSLAISEQQGFFNSLYLFSRAKTIYSISKSLSYVALISSIESLLDKPKVLKKCDECLQNILEISISQKFKNFVEKFAPGLEDKDRQILYDLRSNIVHGNRLLEIDNKPFSSWLLPSIMDDHKRVEICLNVVKIALINYLHLS